MPGNIQSVTETIADVVSWRPVLEPLLRTFEPLLVARAELAQDLRQDLRRLGLALPQSSATRMGLGLSLLADEKATGMAEPLRMSAERLLPLFAELEALAPHIPALREFFLRPICAEQHEDGQDVRESLAEALVSGNRDTVERLADDSKLDPSILEFVAGFVVSAVLMALVAEALVDGQGPWNEGDMWQQGYCPVCGALPSIGWLDKPAVDEKNAYLAGGGGKKYLHCGQCGADWRFKRGTCPSCGGENDGSVEILRESGISHGERLDWCTKCKGYSPTVDLREREFIPNLEAAALGMMHLDMVAANKKLQPLRPSFWNMF